MQLQKLTNCIGAHPMQHATFGDGFEGRAAQDAVHPLLQEVAVAELMPHVHGELLQLSVVGVGHARETQAEPGRRRLQPNESADSQM